MSPEIEKRVKSNWFYPKSRRAKKDGRVTGTWDPWIDLDYAKRGSHVTLLNKFWHRSISQKKMTNSSYLTNPLLLNHSHVSHSFRLTSIFLCGKKSSYWRLCPYEVKDSHCYLNMPYCCCFLINTGSNINFWVVVSLLSSRGIHCCCFTSFKLLFYTSIFCVERNMVVMYLVPCCKYLNFKLLFYKLLQLFLNCSCCCYEFTAVATVLVMMLYLWWCYL